MQDAPHSNAEWGNLDSPSDRFFSEIKTIHFTKTRLNLKKMFLIN